MAHAVYLATTALRQKQRCRAIVRVAVAARQRELWKDVKVAALNWSMASAEMSQAPSVHWKPAHHENEGARSFVEPSPRKKQLLWEEEDLHPLAIQSGERSACQRRRSLCPYSVHGSAEAQLGRIACPVTAGHGSPRDQRRLQKDQKGFVGACAIEMRLDSAREAFYAKNCR